jgi:tetratricopeptide (TPR) repeat protein
MDSLSTRLNHNPLSLVKILSILKRLGSHFLVSDSAKAHQHLFEALPLVKHANSKVDSARILNNIGAVYDINNDVPQALQYYLLSAKLLEQINVTSLLQGTCLSNISRCYPSRQFYFSL